MPVRLWRIFNLRAFDPSLETSLKLPGYKATDIHQTQGLAGFWLSESLDSLLPISRWITGIYVYVFLYFSHHFALPCDFRLNFISSG